SFCVSSPLAHRALRSFPTRRSSDLTLAWVDRGGNGVVPFVSCMLVASMLIASVLLLAQLVQRLNTLQITQVLRIIADKGREVIQDRKSRRLNSSHGSISYAVFCLKK